MVLIVTIYIIKMNKWFKHFMNRLLMITLIIGLYLDHRDRNTERIREAIHIRYMLLPYFYTLFREANTSGVPVVRPLWMEFPSEEATFSNDEAFMIGSSLLVQGIYTEVLQHPDILIIYLAFFSTPCFCVIRIFFLYCCVIFFFFPLYKHARHASVYLPGKESWYEVKTGVAYKGGRTHKLDVNEESVPAFQRAGTIIPRKDRFRRSSTQMVNDPYTLVCL